MSQLYRCRIAHYAVKHEHTKRTVGASESEDENLAVVHSGEGQDSKLLVAATQTGD